MYKESFQKLSELRSQLNSMEEELKLLGHCVGVKPSEHVNHALSQFTVLRDGLWAVDRALEKERG
jgi:hypothetical protein